MAVQDQLILNSRRPDGDPVTSAAKIYIGRTIDIQPVLAGDKRPHLPPDPAVDPDIHQHRSGDLVLVERHADVRRHRDGVSVQKRRPNGDVFVALVCGREESREGDLLVVVGGVDIDLVVVNADSAVGVARGEGDLEVGGEGVGGAGEVEGVDCGVLEDEMRLGGAEDEPYEEDEEEDQDDEAYEGGEEVAVQLLTVVIVIVVVAAFFCRHGGAVEVVVVLCEGE